MDHRKYEQLLKKKENAQAVLPQAFSMMASDYYAYGRLNLAMHYYNYYEDMQENPLVDCDVLFVKITEWMQETLVGQFSGENREKTVKELDALRTIIMETMQRFTEDTDRLSIYEYILNRMEKGYEDCVTEIENDTAVQTVYQAIFQDKDQMLIHSRIRHMLAQLPVRMTREHFFQLLKTSFDAYEGNERSSLDDYLYMLRSAAGIKIGESKNALSLDALMEIQEVLVELSQKEYTMLTKEEFLYCTERLGKAADLIRVYTDRFLKLQEIVNAFYCVLLNAPYQQAEDDENVTSLLSYLVKTAANREFTDEMIITSLFEKTEGKIESVTHNLLQDESMLEQISKSYDSMLDALMLRKQFTCLLWSEKLCSNSAFIRLHEETNHQVCDKEFIKSSYAQFSEELKQQISTRNKQYHRAVIAAVLREMPVVFTKSEEVLDYIKGSIAGCHDLSEKAVSIELFLESIK